MVVDKRKSRISLFFIHLFFMLFCVACIIPLIAVISVSFSSEMDISKYGYSLIPREINLDAYRYILANPFQFLSAYRVSIFVTVVGTIMGLLVMSTMAYVLSRESYRYRNQLAFYLFFTMLFSGGLVPYYILITQYLHLKDTIWVLILPSLVNPWNVILLRTFFQKIPAALIESAKIDGARELRIFFAIVVPLSKPALATVALFTSLAYWNDWWLSLLFITKERLVPLQFMLQRMMSTLEFLTTHAQNIPSGMSENNLPNESARMAMCILAIGPMLFAYPFFQKYFVRGLTVGSVKG